ncbi:MAG TPA: type VI secretion system baseplate subunit TssE [Terriglobales bacterium]|nr:type VI secretion system baseplate subunit TssE [Terriglobales bacterium]
MGRTAPECIITQSLLDRLTDEDPGNRTDPPLTRAQSFRQFKTSLKRDLEWLLNTRRTPAPAPESLRNLTRSLYNFGLPDISALTTSSSRDRNRLQWLLEGAVNTFEPRIAGARVVMEAPAAGMRTLRFRIEGLMRIDPAPEHVTFDTVLELTSGEYQVK